ncbi:MAG TPA: hypothetical protein PKA00_22810 [Saprospiraceae bacterium]|nr:hypothetical protein [Saprospiraceae bacterium]HMQ85760.1 hypothetical protein [Saprospiraceae bacterium]
MTPAENINDFVNNLLLGFLTKEEEAFYVPVYEEKLMEIKDLILHDRLENQTIYVMGQVGTGKTTALNFLPDEDINGQFEVVTFYATDLFDMNDVDIADVLLIIAYQLMRGHSSLERKFQHELEKIKKKLEGVSFETIEEDHINRGGGAEIRAGIGNSPIGRFLGLLKAGVDVFANIRMDSHSREIVRQVFNVSPRDIFEVTNKVVAAYVEEVLKYKRKLLLVFNELDHVRNAEKIKKLFVDNRQYLDRLHCKKVISVPVVLMTYGEFQQSRDIISEYLGMKLLPNPIIGQPPSVEVQTEIERNKALFRQIVSKRIAPGLQLISEDAVDYAIAKSGGIIRQFIKILSYAGRRVRMLNRPLITQEDVDYGADRVRQELEASIIGMEKIRLLESVRVNHTPKVGNEDLLIECFLANQIIGIRNEPTWYSLNPLIEETVEIYANQSSETDN